METLKNPYVLGAIGIGAFILLLRGGGGGSNSGSQATSTLAVATQANAVMSQEETARQATFQQYDILKQQGNIENLKNILDYRLQEYDLKSKTDLARIDMYTNYAKQESASTLGYLQNLNQNHASLSALSQQLSHDVTIENLRARSELSLARLNSDALVTMTNINAQTEQFIAKQQRKTAQALSRDSLIGSITGKLIDTGGKMASTAMLA